MGSMITVNEKKDFLRWFLQSFQLKRRECAWLLNYLISDDSLMEKVHFVERAEFCPKAIIISTTDVEHIPFTFHKHKHVTMDAEKAFHDIRLNNEEDIYVQLHFVGSKSNILYVTVLEENPFVPESLEMSSTYGVLAEMILDQSIEAYEKSKLALEIDKALDEKDEERFNELSAKMKNFETLD